MNTSNAIPLVRTAVFLPFVDAARGIGVPIERLLQSAGLPTLLTDTPELLLPELRCRRFIQDVSRREDVVDFGLLAARTRTHQDISTLKPLLVGCSNLHELLKRFCAVATLQAQTGVYALKRRGDLVWFSHLGMRQIPEDSQIELFKVLGMIQLVQMAAGSDWRPTEIHLAFGHRKSVEVAADLQPSRIRYHQPHPSIAIPRQLLWLPLHGLGAGKVADMPGSSGANGRSALAPLPDSISESVRQVITPYLENGRLDKRVAADLAGLSPRTLQRRLSEQGTSFSELLNQARLIRAVTLLTETEEKLVDISLMLGYKNASTFTRAFRYWTGVSPRAFRKL